MDETSLRFIEYNDSYDESSVVIVPVPYEQTTSYVGGTKNAPNAILKASFQLEEYDEEMDFDALWEELAVSSEIWMRLVDREIKGLIVQTYIDWYLEQGIAIKNPVVDYMLLLDNMALHNADLFEQSFQNVLMFVAVMEYDFDNGENKDQLAQRILGRQLYEENRKRFMGK